jgi:hypothetical protein
MTSDYKNQIFSTAVRGIGYRCAPTLAVLSIACPLGLNQLKNRQVSATRRHNPERNKQENACNPPASLIQSPKKAETASRLSST